MNTVHGLHGTRMGRRVEDPSKVIEECLQSRNRGPQSDTPEPINTSPISSGPAVGLCRSTMARGANDDFYFFDVPYQDRVIGCIKRPLKLLDDGKQKTLDEHLNWIKTPNNPIGQTIGNLELEFQLARISFELRDDPQYNAIAREYIRGLRKIFGVPILTSDKLEFYPGGFRIVDLGGIQTRLNSQIGSHPFKADDSNGLFLSESRVEQEFLEYLPVPVDVKPFLQTLLGQGYEKAGMVFSYIAPRNGPLLKAVEIAFTPVDSYCHLGCMVDTFVIESLKPDVHRSALGVTEVVKSFAQIVFGGGTK